MGSEIKLVGNLGGKNNFRGREIIFFFPLKKYGNRIMSSLSFLGNETSYLSIPNSSDFNFRTGDFTIEWYQYQTDSNSFSRIFQIGTYPNTSIGVSIEGGDFLYWTNDTYNSITTINRNQWIHFAICRASGTTQIFKNGTSIYSTSVIDDFNDATNTLTIGNESTRTNGAAFGGYLTYFSWVKGVARYTSNFTVSNQYPPDTNTQVLLLKASEFGGTLGSSVVNSNVSTTPNVPPGFSQNTPVANPVAKMFKSMFSNNSVVYYKPNSLASCGVGSVRNSSIKARKT